MFQLLTEKFSLIVDRLKGRANLSEANIVTHLRPYGNDVIGLDPQAKGDIKSGIIRGDV